MYPKLKSIIIESSDFRKLDLVDAEIVELRPILSSTNETFAVMASLAENVLPSLEVGIDDVRVMGIKGVEGGGKTILARAIFDKISHKFEGQSFVEKIGEVSKASLNGLSSLQKQILSDVFKDQIITINNVYDGKKMMRRMMPGRRVLVVLDDVDHNNQLEELLVDLKWYKPGSRIIITTRDAHVLLVLRAHGVTVNIINVNVNQLSNKDSLILFSKNAFGHEIPIQTYENISEQVVHYTTRVSLAIKVLGSYLSGKDELKWIGALNKLQVPKRMAPNELLKKLEASYKSLKDEYQEIFLDVACLLKGWKKDKAIRALESQGLDATVGLKALEERSLIIIPKDNCLKMHDLVEEMGKNIVRHLHPHKPWRHSRLWVEAEIKDILDNDQGTDETTGIHLRYTQELDPESFMRGLRNMKKLRFLYLESDMDNFYDDSRSRWCRINVQGLFQFVNVLD
ncbi:TMV resistance protein N-like [Rutidosis leptorrhynchoides]|uniref:TMV resistance protein N-like n=1 Tax=Rutidosis leptorrhynchoides TaxID=125765 RepID=UPI003A99D2CD